MKQCKRCASKTGLSNEEIEKMVNEVRNMRGIKLVDDDKYNDRLAACGSCDKFLYGSTCSICGCVMQVRALLTTGKCPYPKQARWC